MQILEFIATKRERRPLSHEEIQEFIGGVTNHSIPDYQITAWLMAAACNDLDEQETIALTQAMASSGRQLKMREVLGVSVADKHSTGGVGDKVSLVVVPIVAAYGIPVAKMAGRGLGHTGGTIDKLESVSGLRTELSSAEFTALVKKNKLAISAQSPDLAPADGILYSLRDVTATVSSIPLIASSIMSKKLAIDPSHLLLDVKVGSGALIKRQEDAETLAKLMIEIGNAAGITTRAILSNMDQPLGSAVGNANELAEAIVILQGRGPADVAELCRHEAATLIHMADSTVSIEQAYEQVRHIIDTGAALEKLRVMVEAQSGDPHQIDDPRLLPQAPIHKDLPAPRTGIVRAIDAERIGRVVVLLGAGRATKGSAIDHSVGVLLAKHVGDVVVRGEPLLTIQARTPEDIGKVTPLLVSAFDLSESDTPPVSQPLIIAEY
jgi:pyrimidine-nucleoside phosphorylase